MFERVLSHRFRRWLDALRPDADLAAAEGMAAGLGLLTGQVARSTTRTGAPVEDCPACGGACAIVVLDLVGLATTRKCARCARRWVTSDDTRGPSTPAATGIVNHEVNARRG